jgi:hypothetical protein
MKISGAVASSTIAPHAAMGSPDRRQALSCGQRPFTNVAKIESAKPKRAARLYRQRTRGWRLLVQGLRLRSFHAQPYHDDLHWKTAFTRHGGTAQRGISGKRRRLWLHRPGYPLRDIHHRSPASRFSSNEAGLVLLDAASSTQLRGPRASRRRWLSPAHAHGQRRGQGL